MAIWDTMAMWKVHILNRNIEWSGNDVTVKLAPGAKI